MALYQQYETSFRIENRPYHAAMHIEQEEHDGVAHYRAVIDDPPLHGTFGGAAETVEMALDYLNLAMQAEGADAITFTPVPLEAAG